MGFTVKEKDDASDFCKYFVLFFLGWEKLKKAEGRGNVILK